MTPEEIERRKRIRLSVAAYAYEMEANPTISDAEFDSLARSINPGMSTVEDRHDEKTKERYAKIDRFFAEKFSPDTGQWIYGHPELDRVRYVYDLVKGNRR